MKPEFGQKVCITHFLRRESHNKVRENYGAVWCKSWKTVPYLMQRSGICIGYRTLTNGENQFYSDEPIAFTPKESFKAYLVVTNPRQRPVHVLEEHIYEEAPDPPSEISEDDLIDANVLDYEEKPIYGELPDSTFTP